MSELSMISICSLLGKLPDEVEDGLGERLDLWMVINNKRREWMMNHISKAHSRASDAKENAYQYIMSQILVQQAMWGTL